MALYTCRCYSTCSFLRLSLSVIFPTQSSWASIPKTDFITHSCVLLKQQLLSGSQLFASNFFMTAIIMGHLGDASSRVSRELDLGFSIRIATIYWMLAPVLMCFLWNLYPNIVRHWLWSLFYRSGGCIRQKTHHLSLTWVREPGTDLHLNDPKVYLLLTSLLYAPLIYGC